MSGDHTDPIGHGEIERLRDTLRMWGFDETPDGRYLKRETMVRINYRHKDWSITVSPRRNPQPGDGVVWKFLPEVQTELPDRLYHQIARLSGSNQ